jgi:hypothetical protein
MDATFHVPARRDRPSSLEFPMFRIARAERYPPAFQANSLPPPAAARLKALLGEATPEQASYEAIADPGLPVVGAVGLQDGRVFAVINLPEVQEQASVFALNADRLAAAVAEQEVAQKIVQTSSRFAHISKQDEELIGETAMLQSYPATALRSLERAAQVDGPGSDYAAIARVTVRALHGALAIAPRRAGAPAMSGGLALDAYRRFVTDHARTSPTYPAVFAAYARDVLKVENVEHFAAEFESRMVSAFRQEALALTRAR